MTLDRFLIEHTNMLLTTAYVQYSIRVYYSGRERGHIYHVLVYLLCFWLQFILLFMFLFNYRVYYDLPIKGDHCPRWTTN